MQGKSNACGISVFLVYFELQVVALCTRLRAKMRASSGDNLINSEFEVALL